MRGKEHYSQQRKQYVQKPGRGQKKKKKNRQFSRSDREGILTDEAGK